jgi:hypothetical protein
MRLQASPAMRVCWLILGGLGMTLPAAAEPPQVLWLGRFGQSLEPFTELRLKADISPNRFERQRWDGEDALVVHSEASMSLMARAVTLDFRQTPVLCWRWRIDAPLKTADMQRKLGDDYAARLYLSLRLPDGDKSLAQRAQLRLARALFGPQVPDAALNYVWDNRHPVGTEAPNAYTDRTQMRVLRSGAESAGRWVSERRDVAADARRLFGPNAQAAQLAVTADTDNTGERARAGFAQIHAVGAGQDCQFE